MVNEVDTDGNGDIDLPEFISLMARRMKQVDQEEDLVEAFNIFNVSGDGLIRPQVLQDVMEVLGEKATKEEVDMMMEIAVQGKDSINFDEF